MWVYYVAARMLHAGSMEADVIYNTCWASVTYDLSCGSYHGFSVSLSLGLVAALKCNIILNSAKPLNSVWYWENRLWRSWPWYRKHFGVKAANWKLYHDNAPNHTCFVVNNYLTRDGIAMLPQPFPSLQS